MRAEFVSEAWPLADASRTDLDHSGGGGGGALGVGMLALTLLCEL